MNADAEPDARFDAHARALHRHSLEQLSPATRQRLRAARTPTALPRSRAWALGGVAVAIAVMAVVPRPQAPLPTDRAAVSTPVAAAPSSTGDGLAMLDESPDLYLWLASADAAADPMEL